MEIEILSSVEAVRRRPVLWLGDLKRENLFEDLIFEALCHALDEALEHRCRHIQISIEPAGEVFLQYDAGIPLTIHPKTGRPAADVFFTELSACHNLKKHIEVGSNYCQYGLAALNAVCSEFRVDTVCDGQHGKQVYIQGKTAQDFIISASNDRDQTQLRFIFDEVLLGHHEIQLARLLVKAEKIEQDFAVKLDIVYGSTTV
ncbi:hypothetical protein ACQ4M4_15350 [Leptolyngbya sp. AN02str]|uniref:hypothetical protein n=1 Tax=Leptolyngbya sp. AN02str TaxID=3423363 RepID=UPI003D32166B